jgi:MoaA/NifB/PqqE/SkfB family radical SAM enzyme
MTEPGPRDRFRAHALDGAIQYFHPRSGTHVRITGPETRHVRKVAPRVVMFGITNACNLSCSFCSRDKDRASRWTLESAFAVLRDLAQAGALEVAFGGGEPFEFPRFHELIARLHEETALALNVTTNGTRLDRAGWAPFVGRFGQVRVSLYGDRVWRRCAEVFAATGQR